MTHTPTKDASGRAARKIAREHVVKKGRHRRYEEARKFRRDSAASFDIEDYDFDASDDFAGIVESAGDSENNSEDAEQDESYLDLAKKHDPDADLLEDFDDGLADESLDENP